MERLSVDSIIAEEKELYEIMKDRYKETGVHNCKDRMEEHKQLVEWLEELKAYRDAEEQGLLLRLPCKVLDIVYCLNIWGSDWEINELRIRSLNTIVNFLENKAFGKTVFLTKEEAEQKLKEIVS